MFEAMLPRYCVACPSSLAAAPAAWMCALALSPMTTVAASPSVVSIAFFMRCDDATRLPSVRTLSMSSFRLSRNSGRLISGQNFDI
jgi:hypothetical protein